MAVGSTRHVSRYNEPLNVATYGFDLERDVVRTGCQRNRYAMLVLWEFSTSQYG